MPKLYRKHIFDAIHGYIHLNRVEDRIMNSAYFQRLRWIRQLGFTFYIFPGATHTRFTHALGVLHVMDRVLKSIGLAVPDEKLFDPDCNDEPTRFHRLMRLAAMLHDIGTFPFSHTVEMGYINHWKKQRSHGVKVREANHEVLGSHLILNTDFEGGLTRILRQEGVDPIELSKVIAGVSQNLLANQLMHADVDADRMDYLLRDAHYTGVKFGQYDLEMLLKNLTTYDWKGQKGLAVREDAINIVEYFLICRYSWYSQIIDEGTGYKFDLLGAKLAEFFLENGQIYSFEDLMNGVSQDPNQFFSFNDNYFFAKVHEYLGTRRTHPYVRELAEMLAFRAPPKQIRGGAFEPVLVKSLEHRQEVVRIATEAGQWLESELHRLDPDAWIIVDIPVKDVMFTKNAETLRRELRGGDPLLARDPVKILTRQGEPRLLVETSNALLAVLSQYRNFIPRLYVSPRSYERLEAEGLLDELRNRTSVVLKAA